MGVISRGWAYVGRGHRFRLGRSLGFPALLRFLLFDGQRKSWRCRGFCFRIGFEIGRCPNRRRRLCSAPHPGKDDLLPPQQSARRSSRGQQSWIDNRAREQCRLRSGQRGRGHTKVGAGRRFRAPDPVTPLDHVEIDLEDARLRQRDLEPARDDELLDLSERVVGGRQIQILRQLLRDRARPAGRLSRATGCPGSTCVSARRRCLRDPRTRCLQPRAPRASGLVKSANTGPTDRAVWASTLRPLPPARAAP